ncbi:glycerol-3-phosphate 1-O-acyltransferase PlsY [Mesomycoplasma conjunctivae]|uniref:glycerol-3-phosphate 1-O-acyltransferase PlsY n=1 Tax=Mesomycoplasma conjunctivae TaxID=45361 RepID=UPI003DA42C00
MNFLEIFFNIIFILIGYLIGSISFSITFSKIEYTDDIRKYGSKNAGSTNMLRVYGKTMGLMTLIADAFKAYLSVSISFLFMFFVPGLESLIPILAGLGAVVGHIWPVWHKFKGGKGAACILGCLMASNLLIIIIGAIIFITIIVWSRYVSLASIISPIILALILLTPWMTYGILGFLNNKSQAFYTNSIVILVAQLFVIFAHRSNIIRLWKGNEAKLNLKRNIK